MESPHILVADDQSDVLETLQLILKNEGWQCTSVSQPASVIHALEESEFDLLLMDLNYQRDTTSGQEGLDLLDNIRAMENPPPVVVMTAWGSVELAVEALRRGAGDFVEKPWDNLRLLRILKAQLDLSDSRKQSARLSASNSMLSSGGREFIATSPAMSELLETLHSVAESDASVLFIGENGTGKNELAMMLHRQSARFDRTFVTMDVGAITETLFESELFGHTKGAFTDARENKIGRLELADGGTLFLDEIANLAAPQQSRLLRVLETGEYERVGSSQTRRADIRFIAATNANINQLVEDGEFRRDLFYRLNTVTLQAPALRERSEDIPILAEHFLSSVSAKYRRPGLIFSDAANERLQVHAWPGNVRELSHVVERAVLVTRDEVILPAHLGIPASVPDPLPGISLPETSIGTMTLAEMERQLIERTLQQCGGNMTQCATSLGISRSSLYRKMEALGISAE